MYGYVRAYKPDMRFREFDVYHGVYCGLCAALQKRYGLAARFVLSYDMTFLILLLSGLYEPAETAKRVRCPVHPFHKQLHIASDVTDYAADMSLLFFHEKCTDDWMDEKKISARVADGVLARSYRRTLEQYPQKQAQITQQLQRLHAYEEQNETNPDLPAGCFGDIIAELFAWKKDEWETTLRQMGFYFGKFIYLLDAYEDIEKDLKKNRYNPLKKMYESGNGFDAGAEELLALMISSCAEHFERLPILRNIEILRNILYAGVWAQFQTIRQRRQKEIEHGSI